jgi:hypothetical protein
MLWLLSLRDASRRVHPNHERRVARSTVLGGFSSSARAGPASARPSAWRSAAARARGRAPRPRRARPGRAGCSSEPAVFVQPGARVAPLLQARGNGVEPEVAQLGIRHLVPPERGRHARVGIRPHAVRGRDRPDVDAARPGGLRVARQPVFLEHLAHAHGHAPDVAPVGRAGRRVEVHAQLVGMVHVRLGKLTVTCLTHSGALFGRASGRRSRRRRRSGSASSTSGGRACALGADPRSRGSTRAGPASCAREPERRPCPVRERHLRRARG